VKKENSSPDTAYGQGRIGDAARQRASRRAYNTAYQRQRRARLRQENPERFRHLQLAENLRRRYRRREQQPVPKRRGRPVRLDLAHLTKQERIRVLKRESHLRRREAHPEWYRHAYRSYYQRHRDTFATYHRNRQERLKQEDPKQYRQMKEQQRAYSRAYYAAHRDEILERRRQQKQQQEQATEKQGGEEQPAA
jgi:hypothetical protein